MRTFFMLFLSLMMVSAWSQAHTCEPDKVATKYPNLAGKIVKIAASPQQPPFAYSDPANLEKMTGLEVELVEGAMKCAGLKHEFVKGVWSALLPALYSGQADIMIGAVNFRPERAERADFILYMHAGQSVVVRQGNPKKLTDMDSLCGHVGSANANGAPAQTLQKQNYACNEKGKKPIVFLPSVDAESSFRQIRNDRIDFVMEDSVAASTRATKEKDLTIAFTESTSILSGMVVRKGNKEMLQIVADGLRAQEKNGSLAKLVKKYGVDRSLIIPIETRQ